MIKIGTNGISDIFIGSTHAKKAYLGTTLIWEYSSPNGAAIVAGNEI